MATAFSAIAINIEFAILIGAAVSIAWYVTRASKLKFAELIVTPERVARARISSDPESQGVLIYDFEGELFFGAAPDFERYLEKAAEKAKSRGIKFIVLRLKRVRNPDVVALEVLDVFLQDARRNGLTVLLAGVRPAAAARDDCSPCGERRQLAVARGLGVRNDDFDVVLHEIWPITNRVRISASHHKDNR
jgi:SulP family sulfate permease